MALESIVRLRHFEWLSRAISPVPGVVPTEYFPENDADWQAIITLGSAHLVLPILYQALKAKDLWGDIPEDVGMALEGFFELNQGHNSNLRQQMLDVSAVLNAQGITPVWLKGATCLLAEDWEQSPRMMLDLDFWLPDPKTHAKALAVLEADGYVIPPEYEGLSDTKSHHFLRRMKAGMPAGIEIHKDPVDITSNQLLDNEAALRNVEWAMWHGASIGVLSLSDQFLHSYIQCTEMNHAGLMMGQIKLMKIHDFLLRYQSLPEKERGAILGRLKQKPWQQRAQSFFGCLFRFFGLTPSMRTNDNVVKRIQANYEPTLWLNPKTMVLGYNIALFCEMIRTQSLGKPSTWLGKGRRLMARCFSYRPEL